MFLQYGFYHQLNLRKFSLLKKRIKKNEGFRDIAYKDTLGFSTIGFGHLIKKNEKYLLEKKFSKNFLLDLFNLDFTKAFLAFEANYEKKMFSEEVMAILIEMIFQLGIKKQKNLLK